MIVDKSEKSWCKLFAALKDELKTCDFLQVDITRNILEVDGNYLVRQQEHFSDETSNLGEHNTGVDDNEHY